MPTTPKILSLDELRSSTPGEPVYVYLTGDEWKNATRGLTRSRSPIPKGASTLAYIPNPDGGVVILPHCEPEGPTDRCSIRWAPGPGGSMVATCRCRPGRGLPGGDHAIPTPSRCRLALEWGPAGSGGIIRVRFRCVSDGCTGRCTLRLVPSLRGSGGLLTCACSR